MFLGREIRQKGFLGKFLRFLDQKAMAEEARKRLSDLGLLTIQNINQLVETLSGGQRQGVAVARATSFGTKVVIMDEPTAALGVKESRRVLELIAEVRASNIPIILISHLFFKIMNENAELLNGRWAMVGIFAALATYAFTGQIIPGII